MSSPPSRIRGRRFPRPWCSRLRITARGRSPRSIWTSCSMPDSGRATPSICLPSLSGDPWRRIERAIWSTSVAAPRRCLGGILSRRSTPAFPAPRQPDPRSSLQTRGRKKKERRESVHWNQQPTTHSVKLDEGKKKAHPSPAFVSRPSDEFRRHRAEMEKPAPSGAGSFWETSQPTLSGAEKVGVFLARFLFGRLRLFVDRL